MPQNTPRPAIIKVWIPRSWINVETEEEQSGPFPGAVPKKGTGCYSENYVTRVTFHLWGSETNEDSEKCDSVTVGIVELNDGSIQSVFPHTIKFLDIQ